MTDAVTEWAWVEGKVVPSADARIPLWDRGFFFAEAAYEAYVGRGGRIFAFNEHQERLKRTLEGIRLPEVNSTMSIVADACSDLVRTFGNGTFLLYVQVTGGIAPRNHVLKEDPRPAVYATIRPWDRSALFRDQETGISVATFQDIRWPKATWKTTQLLGNVLGKKHARDVGADEVMFLDADGNVLEGGATNVFMVEKGRLVTASTQANILPGVSRLGVRTFLGQDVAEERIPLARFLAADEAFVSGTTREVTAIVKVDGQPFRGGRPGPVTRRLSQAFTAVFDRDCPPS